MDVAAGTAGADPAYDEPEPDIAIVRGTNDD